MENEEQKLARPEQSDFERMDAFDEEQILAQMQGSAVSEDYFYEFTNKEGKLVVGISWNGIKAFSHSMSRLGIPLSTEKIEFEDLGDRVRAKAYVRFMPTGEIHLGISHQNKKMEVWANKEKTEKKLVDDPYCDEKVASKSKRNAIRECIPEQAIKGEYLRWKEQKNLGKWPEPPSAEGIANAVRRGKGKAVETKPVEKSESVPPVESKVSGQEQALKAELEGKAFTFSEDEAPFDSFFVSKILKGMQEKHPAFSWSFKRNASQEVEAVLLSGLDDDYDVKGVRSAFDWTIKKIGENRSKEK